jgi:hypothetical protein
MGKTWRWWLILMVIILSSALIVSAATGLYWWNLQRKLMSLELQETATAAELKDVAEQLCWFPWGDPHDAFITLIEDGDASSIPALLTGLRWQPDTPPGGAMICTKLHCLKALRRITGHNAGLNYSDWRKWWDDVGRTLPPSTFPLQESAAPSP